MQKENCAVRNSSIGLCGTKYYVVQTQTKDVRVMYFYRGIYYLSLGRCLTEGKCVIFDFLGFCSTKV